jgi:hypothetical protein
MVLKSESCASASKLLESPRGSNLLGLSYAMALSPSIERVYMIVNLSDGK